MIRLPQVADVAREPSYSERFLREAEKKGKIPRAKRDLNGWRVYTQEDIVRLKELGCLSLMNCKVASKSLFAMVEL